MIWPSCSNVVEGRQGYDPACPIVWSDSQRRRIVRKLAAPDATFVKERVNRVRGLRTRPQFTQKVQVRGQSAPPLSNRVGNLW